MVDDTWCRKCRVLFHWKAFFLLFSAGYKGICEGRMQTDNLMYRTGILYRFALIFFLPLLFFGSAVALKSEFKHVRVSKPQTMLPRLRSFLGSEAQAVGTLTKLTHFMRFLEPRVC